jgi:hypothetical protein
LHFRCQRFIDLDGSKIGEAVTSNTALKKATDAVDAAWQRWKQDRSAANEAAYDKAYQDWKRHGDGRSVGRPPSGDQSSLTSSERAQAVRLRQQQSAARWEKVAPLIQELRRAVDADDGPAVSRIANSLVKETAMVLTGFQVVHAQPNSDLVVLHGWHGKEMVLAFIPKTPLEDHFRRQRLSGKEANLVVDRNLEAFARIISAKYERGEHRPYSRFGSTLPSVDITLEDIETSGETLTDSVLDMPAGWMSSNGRWVPA